MANRYKRKDVLTALRNMVLPVCSDVHTSNRETVKTTKEKFVIIKLMDVQPYADTHNSTFVQFQLFAKDVANGVESVARMESLIDGLSQLFPFNTGLVSCNNTPILTSSKSDGMGYHSVTMQFRAVIRL